MRKIKAHVKTSPDRNLTYKLYRDTVEANVPASADLLALLTPVMTIDEAVIAKKAFLVSEEEAAVDVTSIITTQFVPYTIRHTMLKSMLHGLIIKIDYADSTSITYTVKFNNSEVVTSVRDNLGADHDVSDLFDLSQRSLIGIKDTLVTNAIKVRVSYYTEVIEVIDYNDPQVGVTYTGPVPLGKITTSLTKNLKNVSENALIIPYFEILPSAVTAAENYCYRMLAFDSMNNISDPSELMKVQLQQPLAELKYSLQVCLNTATPNPVWTDSGYIVKSGEIVNFGKYDLAEFETMGSILINKTVPPVPQSSVQANYSSDETSVTLVFKNPWTDSTFRTRKTKAFRLKATFDSNATINVYSSILQHEEVQVDIDTAKIYRQLVTNPSAPFDMSQAELIGEFCFNNGRAHNNALSTGSNPVLTPALNLGKTTYNGEPAIPYVPMANGGGSDTLVVVDNQVDAGKQYRYAIVLEDVMDSTSTPVYYNIITTTV